MGRYKTDIVVCDNTSKAAFNCVRTVTPGQGTCVFQLTGGTGGCGTTGVVSGCCCAWTVPAGITSIIVELWGGGGGGGSAVGCMCCHYGSGGGGGAYSRKTLTGLTAGTVYTICAGPGGCGGGKAGMSGAACCCGIGGGTTYMTGTGLTNFCAGGGFGGDSRCGGYLGHKNHNGGCAGAGGDLNVRGYNGGFHYHNQSCWDVGWGWGGGSPFGGRNMYIAGDKCSMYSDKCATGKAGGGVCGLTGNFPGGGGTGGNTSCCCGICVCGGDGAPGLIRIWM